jgi:hypothetical protein
MFLEPFEFPQPTGEPFVALQPCDRPPAYVYLFHSPEIDAYKIGRTKEARCLKGRLRERQRQCGKTNVLALWRCHPDEAPGIEKELLRKAKPYQISRESFAWQGDFIELYAIFMETATWKAYSMDIVWQQPLGMKNFKKATTTVEEYLEQVNLLQ